MTPSTPTPPPYAVVVLAGGRSRRMGRDKATLPHPRDGRPLLLRQCTLVANLSPAPTQLLVSLRCDQPAPIDLPPGWQVVRDDGKAGPLGGIVAALRACNAPRLLVVAVDLPGLDGATLQTLLTFSPSTGVVPHTHEGIEPLAAIYPRSSLPAAEAAIQAGHLRLRDFVARPEFIVWPAPNPDCFRNWNCPADVARDAND